MRAGPTVSGSSPNLNEDHMDKQMDSGVGLHFMRSDYRSDEEMLVGAMDKDMVGTDLAPFHARFYEIFYFILLFWGPTRKPSLKPELLK